MNALEFLHYLNYSIAVPISYLLFIIAVYFTLRLGFLQIRGLPRFFYLLSHGVKRQRKEHLKSINPFHALFTAMSTTIGIGTIVSPSIAIITGGPGALFWLIFYSWLGAATKFTEVTFGIAFRTKTADGSILGGPMQYLNKAHALLGPWYAFATIFLFSGWSGLQSNVLAETLAQESIPEWVTGLVLAILVFVVLRGGAKRVGTFNSKLVPIMTILYISISLAILLLHVPAVMAALRLMLIDAFAPGPFAGGLIGATFLNTFREGVYKAAYITESGLGTAAIPHSMADTDIPSDQGILAMVSVYADTFLCLLSGLLVLSSGIWQVDRITNVLMYYVFQNGLPYLGRPILIITICMFALGTIIGNSFNGRQSFASLTRYRGMNIYYFFACLIIFYGSVIDAPLAWQIIELLLPLVAIPNALCLIFLSHRYSSLLQITKK